MARTVERYQNPSIGDDVNLRLFSYNNNNFADFDSIEKIEIFFLDPNNITQENPDGRRLVETIDGDAVQSTETGQYLISVNLEEARYTIGRFLDVWHVTISTDQPNNIVQNFFDVLPSKWFTTPIPVVYDFDFHFQPNKMRKGSKQYIVIEIKPNVPLATDLKRYYENLAIAAELMITMEQVCGDCIPVGCDLRRVIDQEPVVFREKRFGYYQLDTEELDCGVYDVTFQLDFGGNRYISDKMQFQIY